MKGLSGFMCAINILLVIGLSIAILDDGATTFRISMLAFNSLSAGILLRGLYS